jgi:hypothetical protein
MYMWMEDGYSQQQKEQVAARLLTSWLKLLAEPFSVKSCDKPGTSDR